MVWDVISTNFEGDETANFGPRKESGIALYQIDTLATISPREETAEQGPPAVVSSVLGELSCIAVDRHINILKDCQFSGTLELNAAVEEAEWSPDGCVLVIGDVQGTLYIINVDAMSTVFSSRVCKPSPAGGAFSRIAFYSKSDDEYDLVILSRSGEMIVLPQITLDVFLTENRAEAARVIKEKMYLIQTGDVHQEGVTDVIPLGDVIITMGCGEYILAVWEWEAGDLQLADYVCSDMLQGAGILQGKVTTDRNYIFLLDTNHTLSLWNLPSLVLIKLWRGLDVHQFQLLETVDIRDQSLNGIKLVILTVTEEKTSTLMVQNLPKCEEIYSLQLSAPSIISKCLTVQETLYVAECCAESESPEWISTVRFRCLTETNPQTRLNRILRKHRFEEAEQFAKLFGLDTEIVQKKKLGHFLEQLSPWNVMKYSTDMMTEMITQLWACMDLIQDDLHVCEMGMRSALPYMDTTKQMMAYCRKRLENFAKSRTDGESIHNQASLMTKLVKIENRLVTFGLAFGVEKYSGKVWDMFLKADLLQQTDNLFDQRKVAAGLVIWVRHEADWQNSLNSSLTTKMLSWLPEQLSAKEVLGLMRDTFIPSLARQHPQSLALLTKWIVQKAKNMELQEEEGWPMNAIIFLKSIHKSLCQATEIGHSEHSITTDISNRACLDPEVITEPIHVLISELKHLYDLHTKYRCRLSYSQFIKETTESITFRMLDEVVALELMDQTLDTQVRPYMKDHGLEENSIFSQYIKDLLERVGGVTSYSIETPWEAKVIAITNRISAPEEKCNAIIEMMKWVPIPWSREIDKLINAGLDLNHPKVVELQKQCRIMDVKKIMLKYGLESKHMPDIYDAHKLMYLMLSRSQDSCMEDALSVMRSYQINIEKELYIFRLRTLILAETVDKAVELLKTLSPDMCVVSGRRIITFAQVVLNDMLVIEQQENEKRWRLCAEAGVYFTRHLLSLTNENIEATELKSLLDNFSGVRALQVEYGTYISLVQFDDESFRKSVLMDYVMEFFQRRSRSEKGSTGFVKIYRMADILGIPRIRLQGELAIEAARTGQVEAALRMCRELFESDSSVETADIAYEVAMAFVRLQADAVSDLGVRSLRDLPSITYRLACQAIATCSQDKLMQCLELCTVADLTRSVNSQCEVTEHSTGLEDWTVEGSVDLLTDTKFDDTFKEDALVMNSHVILPLVSQYQMATCLVSQQESAELGGPIGDGKATPVQNMCNCVVPVLQHLHDNSHLEMAYRYILHTVSTVTQYITQHDMGIVRQAEERCHQEGQQRILQVVENMAASWIKSLVTAVVMKIFNSQQVDHTLALIYAFSRPRKDGLETLLRIVKSTGHNYNKLKALAKVAYALGCFHKEAKVMEMCTDLEMNSTWGRRLNKIKINFKDAFQRPPSEKIKLLPQLAQCEAASMSLVKDFCRDFGLDENVGMLLFLDHMFTVPGRATLSVSAKRALYIKARDTIREIKVPQDLLEKLVTIYKKTDAYDYETLEFLLLEMQKIEKDNQRETSLKLLDYLKVYKRQSPPGEYELQYQPKQDTEAKEEVSIVVDMLPPDSKTRLPLHPFNDGEAWKIITPELKKDTIMSWLPIAALLKLSADQIYLVTVQNMVRKHVQVTKIVVVGDALPDKSMWNWNEKDANLTMLSEVEALLENVSKCELALACTSWMVKELPFGAEKVKALKGCIRYAELWSRAAKDKSHEKDKAMAVYAKFTTMWQRMATEQVLFMHKVPEFVSMAGNPYKLLNQLYEHPSIVNQDITDKQKPDIHTIAHQVADTNNINFEELRISLIQRWLPSSSSKQMDMDSTMTFSFDQLKLGDETMLNIDNDEHANLQRVLYLLQRGNADHIAYLYNFAFKQENLEEAVNITNLCRFRALHCLLKIGDQEALQILFNRSLDDIRHLMRIMLYLVDLENLHIHHSVESFQEANKEGLIKGIWRNHCHQKAASLLVASLSLDYDVYDHHIWTNVLQQLYSFQLLSPLEYVLMRLASVEMRQIPVLPKLWQAVLSTPLTKVEVPLTNSQTELCVHYFNLILHCPVLMDIDLLSLARLYQKLDMPACVLGCLLIGRDDHHQHIKMYMTEDVAVLLDNARHLLNFGLDLTTYERICSVSEDLV